MPLGKSQLEDIQDGASIFFEHSFTTERSAEHAGVGTGLHGEADPSTTPKSSSSGTSAPRGRGKDLLQRLMEKGLIPLAALDVIRGWMLLEMCVTNEEDKRLVKAATRNRLSYSEIRQALMSMFEEHGTRSPKFFGRHGIFSMEAEEQDPWSSDYNPNYDIASEENYYTSRPGKMMPGIQAGMMVVGAMLTGRHRNGMVAGNKEKKKPASCQKSLRSSRH